MNYQFPVDLTLEKVRAAIAGRDEFIEAVRDDYIVFNYNVAFADTFPPVTNEQEAILRECRGLIFDHSGKLISRRFQKFFNQNERDETREENIDWNQKFWIMDKLDGSMVTPFVKADGEVEWFSKMGRTFITDQIESWMDQNPERKKTYENFARDMHRSELTPIFEWTTPENRIVVQYPVSDLVLIAIRYNNTGEYFNPHVAYLYGKACKIPHVLYNDHGEKLGIDLAMGIREGNAEGIVIRFENGHMIKVKTEWYLSLHRTKSFLEQEKNVVENILNNNLDDLLAVVDEKDRDRLIEYSTSLHHNIQDTAFEILGAMSMVVKNGYDRKGFALNMIGQFPKFYDQIIFKNFDRLSVITKEELSTQIIAWVLTNTGTNAKLEQLKKSLGWNLTYNYRNGGEG